MWVKKEGNRISTIDLFGKTYVLLAGSVGRPWVEAANRISESETGGELVAYCVGPHGEVVDAERKWEAAAGIASTGALLVRPDGFVAWRERRMPTDYEVRLEKVMKEMLCL